VTCRALRALESDPRIAARKVATFGTAKALDEALSENLLGLSFLPKLKRFEYASGELILEQ